MEGSPHGQPLSVLRAPSGPTNSFRADNSGSTFTRTAQRTRLKPCMQHIMTGKAACLSFATVLLLFQPLQNGGSLRAWSLYFTGSAVSLMFVSQTHSNQAPAGVRECSLWMVNKGLSVMQGRNKSFQAALEISRSIAVKLWPHSHERGAVHTFGSPNGGRPHASRSPCRSGDRGLPDDPYRHLSRAPLATCLNWRLSQRARESSSPRSAPLSTSTWQRQTRRPSPRDPRYTPSQPQP